MGQALHALCSYKEYKQTSLQSPPESGWEEDEAPLPARRAQGSCDLVAGLSSNLH